MYRTPTLVILAALLASALLGVGAAAAPSVSWEADVDASYIGRSALQGGNESGRVDAWEVDTRDVASIKLREGLLFRLGFELQRDSFGVSGRSDLPSTLQKSALVVGADVQVGEAFLFRIEIEPGFYSDRFSFSSGAFNAPIILGGSYFMSADLQLVIGLSIDWNRKYPALPGLGFRWKFAKDWVADIILPQPRLEYSLTKPLTLYVGADFRGDTYRITGELQDARAGHDGEKLKDAVVDYSQIRVGGGFQWKLNNNFTMELEGGCLPIHELDFHRVGERIRATDIPPYGSVSLRAAF